jgi:translation initiation factor RLI1
MSAFDRVIPCVHMNHCTLGSGLGGAPPARRWPGRCSSRSGRSGEIGFQDTVEQILGYLTWRETYGVVVMFSYLHRFLFTGQEVFQLVRTLSYGQRAKLALAILILSDANFLVLDEPTSHLDMPAMEAIERALAGYGGALLVISHDRYFIERME